MNFMMFIVVSMVLNGVLGILLWPYTFDVANALFGSNITIAWWQGALMGIIPYLGNITVPAAVIAFFLSVIVL